MSTLVTVVEINTLSNVSLSADYPAAYLSSLLDIVSDHVRAYCLGTLFEPTAIVDERRDNYVRGKTGQLTVRLKNAPLISVTSLEYKSGASTTTIELADADLDLVQAHIYMWCTVPDWHQTIPVVTVCNYMAGYATIPEEVKLAVAQLVLEWIAADDAAADGSGWLVDRYQIGNYSESYSIGEALLGNLGLGSTRSIRAAQLLRRYRRPGVK